MSLAAFLGGGKDQKGQGLLGRANAIAEEERAQNNKMQQIKLEQMLKNAGSTDMPFNLSIVNPADPQGGKNKLNFRYDVNPLYLKDDTQMRIQAENLMTRFAELPDQVKDLYWNDPASRTQLDGIINIVRNQSYTKKYNNDTGELTSYEGVSNQPFYQDEWSYQNIWKVEDKNNMNFSTEQITTDSFLKSMDITPPAGINNNNNTASSKRYDTNTARIIHKNSSTFANLAETNSRGNAPSKTEINNLVDIYSEEDDYLFKNDFGAIVDSITNTMTPLSTRALGGNRYASGFDPKTEQKVYRAIFENQTAVDNGIRTALEMSKLAVGYIDKNGKVQQPLAVVGSALDIVTGVNNFIESITGAAEFLGNQRAIVATEEFITGEKTETGRTYKSREEFLKQKYDGLDIATYQKYGLSGAHIKDEQLRSMYRYKALQIHLTFQLAIAMQGFQGGKAVSDADFDRAWMLLTGNAGNTIFGKMSGTKAVTEGLRVVTEQFGRMAVYNKAYLQAKDGTRERTAKLALAVYDRKALEEGVNTGRFASETIYREEMEGIQWDTLNNLDLDVTNTYDYENEDSLIGGDDDENLFG
jgi:hypothetical protein